MYGGTMIPPHAQMAEGAGGPMYNGLHTNDPAWNPPLKVMPSLAESSDPQQVKHFFIKSFLMIRSSLDALIIILWFQVWPGTWAPHVGNVHLNHVN